MHGSDQELSLDRDYPFPEGNGSGLRGRHTHLFSFFSFVDDLLGTSRDLAAGLGLDEQVYRLVALALFRSTGVFETVEQRWAVARNNRNAALDDWIDDIRLNAHRTLNLTDPEEQCHYSARHLRNLFREKPGCTPMQFVRRQRLTRAMHKLQTADEHGSVTHVARACGHRNTSQFSTDCTRQFGIRPSALLRSARQRGGPLS